MLSIGRTATVVVFLMIFAATARAQTAASDAQTPPAAPESDTPAPAVPIGVLVERSGGSLLRATLGSRTDTDTSTPTTPLAAASYTAVPDTQPKLLHKHDLVTIVVNEQSAYSTNGENDLEKTADYDAQIADYVNLDPSRMRLSPEQPANPLEFKTVASRDVKGTAAVNRQDSVTARITATVIDVKPNGTLVLEAKETIKTDDEVQDMSLTGTCRVDDISADNSVLSTQLYDLHLTKNHKGQVRDTTKRGLIPRLLDWIDPF